LADIVALAAFAARTSVVYPAHYAAVTPTIAASSLLIIPVSIEELNILAIYYCFSASLFARSHCAAIPAIASSFNVAYAVLTF
jgi:hypothetical protein